MATSETQFTLFDLVISPLSRESFVSESWGKSFLRLVGYKGKFESLFSWEELNAILKHHRLPPSQLKLFRDGQQIDPNLFLGTIKGEPRLNPGVLINHLAEGATLILDNIDELAPTLGQLSEAFEEVLRSRTYVNLYASWRTQKGFDLHWDAQDTAILQLSGRKHWKVYPPTRLHPLKEDVEAPLVPTGDPAWDGILEDGEMLHLPRGWWHVAFPLDEPSLHLTVTMVPANGMNLLNWSIKQLKRNPEVRMNVPQLANDSARKAYVERLRELLMELWTDDVLERFLPEWEAAIPLRPRICLPRGPKEARAPISMETNVRLASSRRIGFVTPAENGFVSFVAGGFKGECSTDLVPALKLLSGTVPHSIRELCAQLPNQNDISKLMILITALEMKGAVQKENERSAPRYKDSSANDQDVFRGCDPQT